MADTSSDLLRFLVCSDFLFTTFKPFKRMSSEKDLYEKIALDTLFKRFYKPLRTYAFRFVNDTDLAEDIVQDTFFELWQKRDSIEFEGAVKSYLFKSVYNRSINVMHKKYQNKEYSLDDSNEGEILEQYMSANILNSEQSLLLKELEKEISLFIDTLPPQCKKVFLLSRSYGLKNREIAEQLDVSIKAVEKQIGKALSGLKKHLTEEGLISFLIVLSRIS